MAQQPRRFERVHGTRSWAVLVLRTRTHEENTWRSGVHTVGGGKQLWVPRLELRWASSSMPASASLLAAAHSLHRGGPPAPLEDCRRTFYARCG